MNPEDKVLLREVLEISKDNQNMLEKLQRSNRWAVFFKIVYWTFIIIAAGGAYYAIKPYTDKLGDTYTGFKTELEGVHTVTNKILGR